MNTDLYTLVITGDGLYSWALQPVTPPPLTPNQNLIQLYTTYFCVRSTRITYDNGLEFIYKIIKAMISTPPQKESEMAVRTADSELTARLNRAIF